MLDGLKHKNYIYRCPECNFELAEYPVQLNTLNYKIKCITLIRNTLYIIICSMLLYIINGYLYTIFY